MPIIAHFAGKLSNQYNPTLIRTPIIWRQRMAEFQSLRCSKKPMITVEEIRELYIVEEIQL